MYQIYSSAQNVQVTKCTKYDKNSFSFLFLDNTYADVFRE